MGFVSSSCAKISTSSGFDFPVRSGVSSAAAFGSAALDSSASSSSGGCFAEVDACVFGSQLCLLVREVYLDLFGLLFLGSRLFCGCGFGRAGGFGNGCGCLCRGFCCRLFYGSLFRIFSNADVFLWNRLVRNNGIHTLKMFRVLLGGRTRKVRHK